MRRLSIVSQDAAEGPMSLRSAHLNRLMQGVVQDGPNIPKVRSMKTKLIYFDRSDTYGICHGGALRQDAGTIPKRCPQDGFFTF